MNNEYIAYRTNTFIAIPCDEEFNLIDGNKQVTDINIRDILDDHLMYTTGSVAKNKYSRDTIQEHVFYQYNEQTNAVHIPTNYRTIILSDIERLKGIRYTLYRASRKYNSTVSLSDIYTTNFPPRDYQIPWIEYLNKSYVESTAILDNNMRVLDIQTGKGKTYCSMSSMLNWYMRTLVIVPAHLANQWVKTVGDNTDIPEDKVYRFQGNESIKEAYRLYKEDKFEYDVIIATIQTILGYIDNDGIYDDDFPSMLELTEMLGIGTKIVDEAHLNFETNVLIDLNVNIPMNIYLTATPERSDKSSNKIFANIFGTNLYGFDDYVNYLYHVEIKYELPTAKILTDAMFKSRDYGYSQAKFEKYIMRSSYLMNVMTDMVIRTIDEYYTKPNKRTNVKGKCLLYISTVAFGEKLRDILSKHEYIISNKYDVRSYFSGSSEDNLNGDIIISTFKKLGTGSDISKIRTTTSIHSFGSPVMTDQMAGRVREDKELKDQYAVFLCCSTLGSHLNHSRNRCKTMEKVSKETIIEDYGII